MSEYNVSRIFFNDKRAMRELDSLLNKEGIKRDANLDYTVGIYDDNYDLIATGSCFSNTLRCLVVDSSHQGEGLMNQVISHLINYQYQKNNINLFLYTKCDKERIFSDLGFYKISKVDDKLIFMENRKNGFANYLEKLSAESNIKGNINGAIIMNANPFTLGHLYLVEKASQKCDVLHLFVVSEDASVIPFSVRDKLVKEGTAHIKNIIYHQTGDYIISNATFPSYFLKDSESVITSHAKLDISIFIEIAKKLSITKRFVGEEPFSVVTGLYNKIMKENLENNNIICDIIPRMEINGEIISASNVRKALKDKNFTKLKELVPKTTYDYFTSDEALPIIEKLNKISDVSHY